MIFSNCTHWKNIIFSGIIVVQVIKLETTVCVYSVYSLSKWLDRSKEGTLFLSNLAELISFVFSFWICVGQKGEPGPAGVTGSTGLPGQQGKWHNESTLIFVSDVPTTITDFFIFLTGPPGGGKGIPGAPGPKGPRGKFKFAKYFSFPWVQSNSVTFQFITHCENKIKLANLPFIQLFIMHFAFIILLNFIIFSQLSHNTHILLWFFFH